MELEAVNERWHGVLEACYYAFLERLTALELARAEAEFDAFRALLEAHVDFEEKVVDALPAAARVPEEKRRLVAADHLILRRLLRNVAAALEKVAASDEQRRVLVRSLDGFLRLANVLQHHDLRERQEYYPALVAGLASVERGELGKRMEAAMRAASR